MDNTSSTARAIRAANLMADGFDAKARTAATPELAAEFTRLAGVCRENAARYAKEST